MSTLRFRAAIADMIPSGTRAEYHVRAISGEHIIIDLGPAQVMSTKRGADLFAATYEVKKPHDDDE